MIFNIYFYQKVMKASFFQAAKVRDDNWNGKKKQFINFIRGIQIINKVKTASIKKLLSEVKLKLLKKPR